MFDLSILNNYLTLGKLSLLFGTFSLNKFFDEFSTKLSLYLYH